MPRYLCAPSRLLPFLYHPPNPSTVERVSLLPCGSYLLIVLSAICIIRHKTYTFVTLTCRTYYHAPSHPLTALAVLQLSDFLNHAENIAEDFEKGVSGLQEFDHCFNKCDRCLYGSRRLGQRSGEGALDVGQRGGKGALDGGHVQRERHLGWRRSGSSRLGSEQRTSRRR